MSRQPTVVEQLAQLARFLEAQPTPEQGPTPLQDDFEDFVSRGFKPHRVQSGPRRKRALIACEPCRIRKVRCDLAGSLNRCSNCAHFALECTATSKRRRVSQWLATRSTGTPRSQPLQKGPSHNEPRLFSEHPSQDPAGLSLSSILSQVPLERKTQVDGNSPAPIPPDSESDKAPIYIVASPSSREDLAIPSRDVMCALVESYSRFGYVLAPVIPHATLIDILKSVREEKATPEISPLLLQAIMLKGSTDVPLKCLQRAGYSNRAAAFAILHNKFRDMYCSSWLDRDVTRLQAITIAAQACHSLDFPHGARGWTKVAISLCRRTDPGLQTSDDVSYGLWKCLWWSSFSLDRLIVTAAKDLQPLVDRKSWNIPDYDQAEFEAYLINDADVGDDAENVDKIHGEALVLSRQAVQCFTQKIRLSELIDQKAKEAAESPPSSPDECMYSAYEDGLLEAMFGPPDHNVDDTEDKTADR